MEIMSMIGGRVAIADGIAMCLVADLGMLTLFAPLLNFCRIPQTFYSPINSNGNNLRELSDYSL